ncbi:putative protein kinase CAMK-CDPK family [Helianthus annuus]|nr:putative protein kinase CAMK-CDPK family [Helianthus annuus]KAJ0626322.1 putative protein kinase CAMK-CDPK family [Helianthus annuus]
MELNQPFLSSKVFDRIIQKGNYSERKAAELIKIIVDVIQACHSLRGKLADELKIVDAVVLTYACDEPSTLDRLSTFWFLELGRLEGIFEAVLKGNLDFESDPWPLISDSAKDLIRKMICSRPSNRLTTHKVLCHPWIRENRVAPDRELDPAVLSRLKQFSAMNKLKKMALRVCRYIL